MKKILLLTAMALMSLTLRAEHNTLKRLATTEAKENNVFYTAFVNIEYEFNSYGTVINSKFWYAIDKSTWVEFVPLPSRNHDNYYYFQCEGDTYYFKIEK